jgi:hypothetical protein
LFFEILTPEKLQILKSNYRKLIIFDGAVNITIGILLLFFPLGVARFFGVPQPNSYFYPTILGGVIFGIGIALFLEAYGFNHGIRGLGLAGAIVINICGSGVLFIWLIFRPLAIPVKGYVTLWAIAIIVFTIGIIEIIYRSWKYK